MSGWSIAYYTYCLASLGFLTVLILSVHRPMWLGYCSQALTGMVYVAALDGDLQHWLGIGSEAAPAAILITGAALLVFGFCMVAGVMQPNEQTDHLRKPLYALAAVSALIPFGYLVAPFDAVHTAILCLLTVAFVAQALPPLTWEFLPRPLRPRAMPVIQVSTIVAAAVVIVIGAREGISDSQWLLARRIALVWIVTTGIITMTYMTYIIERTRAATARRAIAAAEQQAATSTMLLEAERAYNRAQRIAALRTEQLSTVSHDLRQPLASLRSMVDMLKREHPEEVGHQASQALDYLDELARSFVNNPGGGGRHEPKDVEKLPIDMLLESLEHMFRSEAQTKGIEIRVVHSSLWVEVPPLPLMRIMANLMANAVKHANCTAVLLGSRRSQRRVSIEILDNGRGVEGDFLPNPAQGHPLRSENGSGLGLNIVQTLCRRHGFVLSAHSEPGRGSHVRVGVPRADPVLKPH